MKILQGVAFVVAIGCLGSAAGDEAIVSLATRYEAGRTLRATTQSSYRMGVTGTERYVDGQLDDSGSNRSGGFLAEAHHFVEVDSVREAASGLVVRRTYELAKVTRTNGASGSGVRERQDDSPLTGVTLEVDRSEGAPRTRALESELDEAALTGQVPELALDILLPEGPVRIGDSWTVDRRALWELLRLDRIVAIFPHESKTGVKRLLGGAMWQLGETFRVDDWTVKVELVETGREVEGRALEVMRVTVEGTGFLPHADKDKPGAPVGERAPGTFCLLEMSGDLLFDRSAGVPVSLQLEGQHLQDRRRYFASGGSQVEDRMIFEGPVAYSVDVEVVE